MTSPADVQAVGMHEPIGGVLIVARIFLLGILGTLLLAPSASASRGHVFETSFSGPCVAEPCLGNLKEPSGVAVNEATGDVYVVDKGSNRVARFSQSGAYLGQFDASASFEVEGKEETTTAAGSGGKAGEIPTGRFEAPEGIAVDNSCALRKLKEPSLAQKECEEEDPSNGDVYVVDAGSEHRVIDKFGAKGEYVGQITEAGGGKFQSRPLDGVAVDPEGAVWVYREQLTLAIAGFTNEILNEFTPPTLSVPFFPDPGFAVDSKGDFYGRQSERIAKYDHTGKALIEEVDEEPSSAVATDESTDDSFIDNLTTIRVSEPDGTELERLGEEKGEKHLSEGAGIGVNASKGSLYVADAGTEKVVVFGPTKPSPPTIESESVANVTSESAELQAEINPRSEANEAASEYVFQYGPCSSSDCLGDGYESSTPTPPGQIAADFEVHPVSAHVQNLKANTTYHFRVIASNSLGAGAPGQETIFRTQSEGGELTLPDERGWELVSPPDKQGAAIEPISETGVVQAAASGNAITYLANAPTEVQPQGFTNQMQVLSSRGPSAWSSRDIGIPHSGATGLAFGPGPEYESFDPELSTSAIQPFGEFIPELSEEASESTAYLHELSGTCGSRCFKPLVTGKPGFANVAEGTVFGEEELCERKVGVLAKVVCGPKFVGASEDLTHVVLRSSAPLKEGAGEQQLYEWSGGILSRVSELPGGEPAEGEAKLGFKDETARNAISADGSRIVWEAEPNLYLRDSALQKTIQLDQSEGCGECTSGGGSFQIASADGSRIFFTDTHRLTAGSGAEPASGKQKADLYECQITVSGKEPHCALSDLTPKRGEESADVQGSVLGASEDGSYLYFVAKGVQSEEANARGQKAIAGKANLYLRHGTSTSFIATLGDGDGHDWGQGLGQPTRVSPNGQYLELMSEARLSGYDNRDVATSKPAAEVFIYGAASKALSCASCEPSGARPVGVKYHLLEPGSGGLVGGPRGIWPDAALVAANVPGTMAINAIPDHRYQPRYLSDAGRLFFNSADALVSQDSNGTQDVYEYEPPGVGSCSEESDTFSARSGGCVSLISSGASSQESAFMDASRSGDDVFFLTAAKLSPLDEDAAFDIYDAHSCSDSPCIVTSSVQSPPCTTEASCKAPPTPQPSIFGAPASATFSGPGNQTPPSPPLPPKETKAQKLAKALKACRAKREKKKRKACERQARKKYAAKPAKKKPKPKAKRRKRS